MTEPLLAAWESFYVIVGSSAAALTGLQFVVIALAADRGISSSSTTTSFSTPTVVHFTMVLGISAVLSAPWPAPTWPIALIGIAGLGGCAYVAMVVRAARRQQYYRPVLEDMIWHWCLPAAGYAALVVCGLFRTHASAALAGIAGVAMLLMVIGIHNAWDSAVFISQRGKSQP